MTTHGSDVLHGHARKAYKASKRSHFTETSEYHAGK